MAAIARAGPEHHGNQMTSQSYSGLDDRLREAWADRARDPARSRELGAELLGIARAAGGAPDVVRALQLMAWGEIARSGFGAARAYVAESLEIAGRCGDRAAEALSLVLLGTVLIRLGEIAEARAGMERARALSREAGERRTEAMALSGLGRIFDGIGEYGASLEHHRESLVIAEAVGAPEEQAEALLGIGNAHDRFAEYREAIESYRRALAIAEETGHLQFQSYATGNIGMTHERLGDIATALSYELRSLALKEDLGDLWGAGVSLNNIGIIYQGLGNYARAFDYLLRALEYAERIGDRSGEMIARHNIGQLYEALGEGGHALGHYQRVTEIARELGDKQGEAFALGHTGHFHALLGDRRQALLYLLRGLRLHQEIGDRYGERNALDAIAVLYRDQDDLSRALEYAGQSLRIAESIGDLRGLIASLVVAGGIDSRRGEHRAAIERLDRALRVARDGSFTGDLLRVIRALGGAHEAAGDVIRHRRYQRLYQEYARRIFNNEQTVRARQLIAAFERKSIRDQAENLGLRDEDLEALFELGPGPEGAGEDAAGTAPSRGPVVVVTTFGELRVSVDGRGLRTGDWGRKKARDLFKFLLIHHRRTVTLDEIMEKLWGGAADRNTELLVMNAVSRIRKALEPDRNPRDRTSMLSSGERTYRLDLGDEAVIDFMQFKELIVMARRSSAGERYRHYEDAAALVTDDFLREDYYEEWTISERDLLKDAFLEALEYLAGEQLRSGLYEQAAETARRILLFDTTSERGYEIVIESLVGRGRVAEARGAYEEYRAVLRRELCVEPDQRLRGIIESAVVPG